MSIFHLLIPENSGTMTNIMSIRKRQPLSPSFPAATAWAACRHPDGASERERDLVRQLAAAYGVVGSESESESESDSGDETARLCGGLFGLAAPAYGGNKPPRATADDAAAAGRWCSAEGGSNDDDGDEEEMPDSSPPPEGLAALGELWGLWRHRDYEDAGTLCRKLTPMVAGDEGFLAAMCSSRRGRRFLRDYARDRLGAKEGVDYDGEDDLCRYLAERGDVPPLLQLPAELVDALASGLSLGPLARLVASGNLGAGHGAVRERLDRLRVSTECPDRPLEAFARAIIADDAHLVRTMIERCDAINPSVSIPVDVLQAVARRHRFLKYELGKKYFPVTLPIGLAVAAAAPETLRVLLEETGGLPMSASMFLPLVRTSMPRWFETLEVFLLETEDRYPAPMVAELLEKDESSDYVDYLEYGKARTAAQRIARKLEDIVLDVAEGKTDDDDDDDDDEELSEKVVDTALDIIRRLQEAVPKLWPLRPNERIEEALSSYDRHDGSMRSRALDRLVSIRKLRPTECGPDCERAKLRVRIAFDLWLILNVSETPKESLDAFMANPTGTSRHLAGLLWNTKGKFSFLDPPKTEAINLNLPLIIPLGTGETESCDKRYPQWVFEWYPSTADATEWAGVTDRVEPLLSWPKMFEFALASDWQSIGRNRRAQDPFRVSMDMMDSRAASIAFPKAGDPNPLTILRELVTHARGSKHHDFAAISLHFMRQLLDANPNLPYATAGGGCSDKRPRVKTERQELEDAIEKSAAESSQTQTGAFLDVVRQLYAVAAGEEDMEDVSDPV
jgi:hypothetical protein